MKIRSCFVANSSSSSFIIGCDSIPTTLDEAKNVWFGTKADYVAPIIIDNLFNTMKPINIDFDKLLLIANTNPYNIYHGDNDIDYDKEYGIIAELASNFVYEYQYPDYGMKTSYQTFIENECKLLKIKSLYELKDYKKQKEVESKFFDDEEIKGFWIKDVESFIRRFSKYKVIMEGEFSDNEGDLNAETEHGDHWERFPTYERFSHH